MSYQTILLDIAHSVATVTLHREAVRNAFNETMIAELHHVFRELTNDAHVRAIVLCANGPVFCAGADLQWMKKMASFSYQENVDDAKRLASMLDQIYRCPQPVIAKVHGDCYGGAIGLIAACDVAVAAESAHFCLSEVKLGLIPATIAPYVIEAMGARTAYRYMVSAERFSAQQAQHMGLVHEVVASDKLDDATHAIVQAIVANGPNAVKEAKKLVRDMTNAIIDERLLTDTAERIATVRASSEAQEGIKAFLEKRTPSWNL